LHHSKEAKTYYRVTDDTQMMIAVGEAIVNSPDRTLPQQGLIDNFIAWSKSPDNNRAPGVTCMGSCVRLDRAQRVYQSTVPGGSFYDSSASNNYDWVETFGWLDCTDADSKGCGANMRVQPVGLLNIDSVSLRSGLAQMQAALTHAHPTALAAADVTAWMVRYLADTVYGTMTPAKLLTDLQAYVSSQYLAGVYHRDYLGPLWVVSSKYKSSIEYIQAGWADIARVLLLLKYALGIVKSSRTNSDTANSRTASSDTAKSLEHYRLLDPCLLTGEGWIAEECFATGLLCFLLYPDNPMQAIRRAAFSSGDSDSIACLTGSFAGAYHGMSAWPHGTDKAIEYAPCIEAIAKGLMLKD